MAQFTAMPALQQQVPTPNLMDLANKAASLNGQLIANTGANLAQHYKRMQGLTSGMMGMYVDAKGGPISRDAIVSFAIKAAKNGLVNPSESANFIAGIPKDQSQMQSYVRKVYSGFQNNAAVLGEQIQNINIGDRTVSANANPLARGGVQRVDGKLGMSPGQAGSPTTFTDSTGTPQQTTVGAYNRGLGQDIGSHFTRTGQPAGQGITQTSLAPSPQQIAVDTNYALFPQGNGGNQLTAAPGGNPFNGHTRGDIPSIPGAAPGVVEAQKASAQASTSTWTSDQAVVGDYSKNMSTITDLIAELNDANTGPLSDYMAKINSIAAQVGLNVGEGQATAVNIMHKATAMLAGSGTVTGNPNTDQSLMNALNSTPNTGMTYNAASGAVAMIKGQWDYKRRMVEAFQNSGKSPMEYNRFRIQYQKIAPSPLILALASGDVPDSVKQNLEKYIGKLPKPQRLSLQKQAASLANGQ